MDISERGKKEALALARWALERQIKESETPKPELSDQMFQEKMGSFVTLKVSGELRGCIGRIEPLSSLGEEIVDLAIGSATHDPRFLAVRPEEVGSLTIEISILSPPEIVKDVSEIRVGEQGLIIEREWNRGLLLPQVAVQEKWTLKTFLDHTCLKAGLPIDAWKDSETVIYSFSAIVFSE